MKTNFYLVANYSSNCMPIIFCFYNRIVISKNATCFKKLHPYFIFNIFFQLIIKRIARKVMFRSVNYLIFNLIVKL